jgi:hypothetical protein
MYAASIQHVSGILFLSNLRRRMARPQKYTALNCLASAAQNMDFAKMQKDI